MCEQFSEGWFDPPFFIDGHVCQKSKQSFNMRAAYSILQDVISAIIPTFSTFQGHDVIFQLALALLKVSITFVTYIFSCILVFVCMTFKLGIRKLKINQEYIRIYGYFFKIV